jgi:hypothetical protein
MTDSEFIRRADITRIRASFGRHIERLEAQRYDIMAEAESQAHAAITAAAHMLDTVLEDLEVGTEGESVWFFPEDV